MRCERCNKSINPAPWRRYCSSCEKKISNDRPWCPLCGERHLWKVHYPSAPAESDDEYVPGPYDGSQGDNEGPMAQPAESDDK